LPAWKTREKDAPQSAFTVCAAMGNAAFDDQVGLDRPDDLLGGNDILQELAAKSF
jgi:hypothetical protein